MQTININLDASWFFSIVSWKIHYNNYYSWQVTGNEKMTEDVWPFFPGHKPHVIQEDTTEIKRDIWTASFCRQQRGSCHAVQNTQSN